ncbi:sigma-70 family RNA polymerase sigma factor [Mesorhizobium sp. LHD-90]|uniref:sigma-70 family RNA polymerase sigma factor n=1 Tax=Mesorhizobium sp. LHD-90 TaxID=3071414 RepID=UPI0027E204E2|nr:sigma-70 family RNA polymerase sigma factor [Mesorhizobium sp. LHD-90]MDQ6433398.1 sigma-70 family RNA polymerase sigma factor [Mesorhizobium sp. LHD-90]
MASDLNDDIVIALRRFAAKCSRAACDADDLVQDVLLAAVGSGRRCSGPGFLAWARGAISNHAKFVARGAAASLPRLPGEVIETLPPAQRVVARLIDAGMGRREIGFLLGLSDVALRQRLSGLRRSLRQHGTSPDYERLERLQGDGPARRALKSAIPGVPRRSFAIRDPDGIPIFFSVRDHVLPGGGNSMRDQHGETQ